MKHVYRAIIFLMVFAGSMAVFSGRIKETHGAGATKTVEQVSPSFPTILVRTQGYDINVLHGYNSNLKASINRENMTPVGIDKKFELVITENETEIRKLKYELRKVNDNSLMDSGEISVLEEKKDGKVATVALDNSIEQGKEYAFKVTAITKDGKKIHYFTHIKYYGTDSFLKEKLDFTTEFHRNTFKKNKVKEIASYLEYTTYEVAETDYTTVDIHSSADKVCWGELEPEVVSEVVPSIKEFNIETAAICYEYYVKLSLGKQEQISKVKEFFRVRYSGGRMYLLKYDRDMQSVFSMDNVNVEKDTIDLGVAGKDTVCVSHSSDAGKLAFVDNGELYEYSLAENTLTQVFTFRNNKTDYVRGAYDQHDIKVVNISDEGNMDFMVYGYMNAGDYEGCVGILWYKYYAAEQRIEEQLFIPMETTYQILKENLDDFSYVSEANVFYFSVNNVIYSYDMVAKKLSVIADQVGDGNYCYVEEAGMLAWQTEANDSKSRELILMDLDTKKKSKIKVGKEQRVLLVGSIDSNVAYGVANAGDIKEEADGGTLIPMFKISIADKSGAVLKEYEEKNVYVKKAYMDGNVVKLERIKKTSAGYSKLKDDSIQSQSSNMEQIMGIKSRVWNEQMIVSYIYLKSGFTMNGTMPDQVLAENTMITENSIVRFDKKEDDSARYYVYAEGVILGAYSSPAKAVNMAEEAMGVVVNQNNQIVYERAGKFKNNAVGNVEKVVVSQGVNSKGACVSMVLQFNHFTANAKELSASDKSVYSLLKKEMKDKAEVLNLKGCTLDEVLYQVSGGRPVIAMVGRDRFVLITEYTETSITYIDPVSGKKQTKGITAATAMFEAAENTFIGYVL